MIRKIELLLGCVFVYAAITMTTIRAEEIAEPINQQEQTTEQHVVDAQASSAEVQERHSQFAETARESRQMDVSGSMRAPRPGVSATGLSSADSLLLAEIAACCCNLTNLITACCSLGGGGGGSCANVGQLSDTGICSNTEWTTIAGIQSAEQTVIGWLKTIMLELRGLC